MPGMEQLGLRVQDFLLQECRISVAGILMQEFCCRNAGHGAVRGLFGDV
jgi:hypothetical protein